MSWRTTNALITDRDMRGPKTKVATEANGNRADLRSEAWGHS